MYVLHPHKYIIVDGCGIIHNNQNLKKEFTPELIDDERPSVGHFSPEFVTGITQDSRKTGLQGEITGRCGQPGNDDASCYGMQLRILYCGTEYLVPGNNLFWH